MTTLADRPNVALLIVDLQEKVVRGVPRRDEVVENVGRLVAQARRLEVPVLWVQDEENMAPGSADWQIVAELTPDDAEPRIAKIYSDSFEDTVLEETLAGLGVGSLYVVGAQSDACIRATIHGAMARGYDVILVSDAHTTEDATEWGAPPPELVIAHTNLYWTYERAPGRTIGTIETAAVDFSGTLAPT